jgi:predicted RecA/RadA family phage recombinase
MPSKFRWVHGDTTHVLAPVESATVIEIGDLVYYDVNFAKPASMQAFQTVKTTNQSNFAGKFLGVAMQASPAGSTKPIRVSTSGVFEYDCTATTFELGNLVAIEENAGRTSLENQKLEKVTATTNAIGRVCRREGTSTTSVQVQLRSTVMHGAVS